MALFLPLDSHGGEGAGTQGRTADLPVLQRFGDLHRGVLRFFRLHERNQNEIRRRNRSLSALNS